MRVSAGTPLRAVSDYEEQVWLIQQQSPERILKHIVSWRLDARADIVALLSAVENLIQQVPDLNARYNLSDDGELIKYAGQTWRDCVEFIAAESYPSAEEYILERQAQAWNAENSPPLTALIISGAGQVIFTLLLHEIAAPAANAGRIARFLQRAWSAEPAPAFSLHYPPLPPLLETFASPVPDLRRSRSARLIAHCGAGPLGTESDRALASRWQTTIAADALSGGDGAIAAAAARFAQFVARLSGRASQALCLMAEDGPRYLTLDAGEESTRLAASVAEALRSPPDAAFPDPAAPWLYVRIRQAPLVDAALPWPGEPLLLPTAAPCPDIALALDAGGPGLTLTLTLGQAVYASSGEYLLAKLADFLQGSEDIAAAPVMKEAAPDSAADDGVNAAAAAILSEFRSALNAPDMTLTDDFFDCGGHSLLATRVIGRLLSDRGLEVHFGDFFSYPTAAALAPHAVASARPASAPAAAGESSAAAPLALAQASLWEAYKAYDYGTIFNLPFALDLLDRVDEDLLEKALTDIVIRHASLRSLFSEEAGEAVQRAVGVAQLADYRWFWRSGESRGVTLEDEAAYRFNLARELPLRVRVLDNPATGRRALSLLVHHMAIDEWSLNVIMQELSQAWTARAAGDAPVWQKPAPAFSDFAARQRAEGINPQHLAWWQQMLRDATRGLALAEPGGAAESSSVAGWLEYRPRPEVTQGLYDLARKNGASLFTVVYAAIALALHKLGNLRDIAIGTSASGRTDPATYETVGYFTTMVAHRVTFDSEQSIGALLAQVRDTINGSMAFADVPMNVIQQSLDIAPEAGLLFDVYIQIHASNALNGSLGGDVRYRQIDANKTESMFGLQFEIMEDIFDGEKRVRLVITYRSARYPEALVKRISAAIDGLLTLMTAPGALNTPLGEVAL